MTDKNEKKNINFKKRKKKTQEILEESSKPGKRSQTRNPLNHRPGLNQEVQFLTNLILSSQNKSNKEQQLKKLKKTYIIFKISGKS
jgi:DNA repair exonuclease SbcCD nuclease subunit